MQQEHSYVIQFQDIRINILTAFYPGGAFTTFSTFGLESFNLIREGEIKYAVLNILVSNIAGLPLVFIGYIASKYLFILLR